MPWEEVEEVEAAEEVEAVEVGEEIEEVEEVELVEEVVPTVDDALIVSKCVADASVSAGASTKQAKALRSPQSTSAGSFHPLEGLLSGLSGAEYGVGEVGARR